MDYVNNLAADNNDNNGNDNGKQSKVADMAKANLEGNGVMFSSDKETGATIEMCTNRDPVVTTDTFAQCDDCGKWVRVEPPTLTEAEAYPLG